MGQGSPQDICDAQPVTCAKYETLATGASDVISRGGTGVLSVDDLKDVAKVVGTLLAEIEAPDSSSADGKRRTGSKKQQDPEMFDEDDEPDENEKEDDLPMPTAQSVRFALVDIMASLMRSNAEDFDTHVAQSMVQLVQKLLDPNSGDSNRCLGFYIADAIASSLGERGTKYWNFFLNPALVAIADKSPMVQQYAAKVVGTAAKLPQFSVAALAGAQAIFAVLQKHGEKYKRRRVKPEQNPTALAVDACVRALGLICEHQEQALGQHAEQIWPKWISSLPIKYDKEVGREVHAQLLGLLAREHPAVANPNALPSVIKVLLDVHKTKMSTSELDKNIAAGIAAIGAEKMSILTQGLKERQRKKAE